MAVTLTKEADALRAEFESVVLPHLEGVFRLTLWLVRDRAEAEDVVQETFAQALQSFHRFRPGSNARAWVLSIMRHVRSNRLRSRRRGPLESTFEDEIERLPALESTPERVTESEVLKALAELPEGFQEVVLLCDIEELSYREIATVLEVPIGTVMSRLHRARRLLRAALADYAAERGIGGQRRSEDNEDELPR